MEKQSKKKDGEIPTMKSIITKDELNLNSDEISVGVIDESMLSEEEKEKVKEFHLNLILKMLIR